MILFLSFDLMGSWFIVIKKVLTLQQLVLEHWIEMVDERKIRVDRFNGVNFEF